MQTYSTKCDWNEITDELGERFEISFNTYKPFACGIVIHPSIDGCVQLRNAHGLRADDIERIELRVHSLVLELTGKKAPRDGLEAQVQRLPRLRGGHHVRAGRRSGVLRRRRRRGPTWSRCATQSCATVDDAHRRSQSADVTIVLHATAARMHVFVEHAIGRLQRPMSDADLERKFHGLVDPVLGAERAERLVEVCAGIAAMKDARKLATETRP